MVLINSKMTHNFISLELVRKLKISITETDGNGVHVGFRMAIKGKGICKGLVLYKQIVVVIEDYLPLDLSSSNIFLGMQWLSTLGTVQVNWKLLVMKISMGDRIVTLKGEERLSKSLVSWKSLLKTI